MMKQKIIKCFSLLVALIYVFSVTGYSVHFCNSSCEMFVAPLFEGLSCQDFHPEHHCSSCSCELSDRSQTAASYDEDCCSDSVYRLAVAGIGKSDEGHSHHHHCNCLCGHCPLSVENGTDFSSVLSGRKDTLIYDSGFSPMDDVRSLFSVWRI